MIVREQVVLQGIQLDDVVRVYRRNSKRKFVGVVTHLCEGCLHVAHLKNGAIENVQIKLDEEYYLISRVIGSIVDDHQEPAQEPTR